MSALDPAITDSWCDSCPTRGRTHQAPESSRDRTERTKWVLPSARPSERPGRPGRHRQPVEHGVPGHQADGGPDEELEADHGRDRIARQSEDRRARRLRGPRRRTAWPAGWPPASTAWCHRTARRRTVLTTSASPTLTPPLVRTASQRAPASSRAAVTAPSSSPTIPRSTGSHPSWRTRARRECRLASRMPPGPRGSPASTSSSPVDSTPIRGRGWTTTSVDTLVGQAPEVGRRERRARRRPRCRRRPRPVRRSGRRCPGRRVGRSPRSTPPASGDTHLEHADRVRPRRQRRTGHDPHGLARSDHRRCRRSGQDGADDIEPDRIRG